MVKNKSSEYTYPSISPKLDMGVMICECREKGHRSVDVIPAAVSHRHVDSYASRHCFLYLLLRTGVGGCRSGFAAQLSFKIFVLASASRTGGRMVAKRKGGWDA